MLSGVLKGPFYEKSSCSEPTGSEPECFCWANSRGSRRKVHQTEGRFVRSPPNALLLSGDISNSVATRIATSLWDDQMHEEAVGEAWSGGVSKAGVCAGGEGTKRAHFNIFASGRRRDGWVSKLLRAKCVHGFTVTKVRVNLEVFYELISRVRLWASPTSFQLQENSLLTWLLKLQAITITNFS